MLFLFQSVLLMAYNNYNTLRRMVMVQNIVLEHKQRGASQKWIFENVIAPSFFISYSTFNRYLSYPAKRELREKEERRRRAKEDPRQLKLFL